MSVIDFETIQPIPTKFGILFGTLVRS